MGRIFMEIVMMKRQFFFYSFFIFTVLLLNACTGEKAENITEDELQGRRKHRYDGMGKLFGEDALVLGGDDRSREEATSGIGVNTYLWRATLDTLSFMPLASADPFGGVIMTEWYVSPKNPHEKTKIDVRILDRVLRADGLKISVFRKVFRKGTWEDERVQPETVKNLEEAILTRARQIKINS